MNDLKIISVKCSKNELENIFPNDQRKTPKLDICLRILKECGISCSKLSTEKMQGGTGDVHFTVDGKYAIKRSCLDAKTLESTEINVMVRMVNQINTSNPKGFNINLPIALVSVLDEETNLPLKCNIQIFPKVQQHEKFHSVGDIIRDIVNLNNNAALSYISKLGEDLAIFNQSNGIKESPNGFNLGLMHGDFGACNILVNKNDSFTLIDNAEFQVDGRIICDLVYFVYFTAICIDGLFPHHTQQVKQINKIIKHLYGGYIKVADEKICKTMARYFSGNNYVLASTIGGYNREFLNTEIWFNTFEPTQKEAFENAYYDRFQSLSNALFFKKTVNMQDMKTINDIMDNYELTTTGSHIDLSSFNNLERIDNLNDFSELECLNLANTKIEDVSPLGKSTKLFSLKLRNTKVLDITPLANILSLKKLDVSENKLLANIAPPVSRLTNLELLNASDTMIDTVQPLSALTNLEELNLSKNNKLIWVGALTTLTKLTKFDLSASSVNDTGSELHKLSTLTKLTSLKALDLSNTSVVKIYNLFPHIPKMNVTAICNVGYGYSLGICCDPYWQNKPSAFDYDQKSKIPHTWKGQVPSGKEWQFVKIKNNQIVVWEKRDNKGNRKNDSDIEVNNIKF